MSGVRVRFAPSPTGLLHPGGTRTALFNYLFARYYRGTLVLRIEDTDRARSTVEYERALIEDLRWLGLTFDEGPYRQSERGGLYESAVERLAEKGLTYESADDEGHRAIYFNPPERAGSFGEGLRGEVPFARVEDFVLIKSDGTPSYNFAAVVDDLDMRITHVIRGEEHISNTARQTLLYRALAAEPPEFIHLGLILSPDGKKLSKRQGDISIAGYRSEGYLPEALVNHLALLGWNHSDGKEEFEDLAELAREWDPTRLGASPATFDPERLLSLNAWHIRNLTPENLLHRMEPFLKKPLPVGRELLAVEAVQQEMRLLSEAPRLIKEITGPVNPDSFAAELAESSGRVFMQTLEELKGWEFQNLEDARNLVAELRAWAKEEGIKTRDLLHPLRLALTGRDRGPEIAYLCAVLGVEESRDRIERAREARLRV